MTGCVCGFDLADNFDKFSVERIEHCGNSASSDSGAAKLSGTFAKGAEV
jgi:hypothetical protein